MAKANKLDKPELVKTPNLIINDLTLVAPNRNSKDILTLKDSVIFAENIYFPNRVQLYDLYHDIFSMDGHLKGIVQKRIDNVLNKKIRFIKKDGSVDDDLTDLIKSSTGRDLINKLMESKFWGISGVEFEIGNEFKFDEIPRKHIKPEKGIITKQQYGSSPIGNFIIDELPFAWVVGDSKDLGLFLSCSLYGIYKRGTFGDYAQFVEIFGQPVRVIKYDAYDTQTKTELRGLLENSGSALAMMIPKQADFEMKDGKMSNADGKLQLGLIEVCNSEMSIVILGNTETTNSSKSSGYAQSKEHGEQQDEITASDLIFIENLLNDKKFKQILKSYGYDTEGKFEYELELNLAKLKLRMEIDTFVSEKVPIGDDYWYETYGIPKPKNYDQLKAKMQQEEEEVETEPNPDKEDKVPGQTDPNKGKLIEKKKTSIKDLVFKNLADFFDQARQ